MGLIKEVLRLDYAANEFSINPAGDRRLLIRVSKVGYLITLNF